VQCSWHIKDVKILLTTRVRVHKQATDKRLPKSSRRNSNVDTVPGCTTDCPKVYGRDHTPLSWRRDHPGRQHDAFERRPRMYLSTATHAHSPTHSRACLPSLHCEITWQSSQATNRQTDGLYHLIKSPHLQQSCLQYSFQFSYKCLVINVGYIVYHVNAATQWCVGLG